MRLARLVALVTLAAALVPACTCAKPSTPPAEEGGAAAVPSAASAVAASQREGGAAALSGLSAPIAGAHVAGGAVVVAGLDVAAGAIRVQRIDAADAVTAERTVLAGVTWSGDADLKLAPAGDGVALTWRGLLGGKLVRQLVFLGADLAQKGEPAEVKAAACSTEDAVWSSDGRRAEARTWTGASGRIELPKDRDVSLSCGAHRAFGLVDEDEGTSVMVLAATDGGTPKSVRLLVDSVFGEDEQRERADYAVGDTLGVVRLAASGALAMRELEGNAPGPLRRLKTKIPHDDDVVAVDASRRAVVIVFTEDASESCKSEAASTRVLALRVDRATFEEFTVTLSPGTCGREVGPFFSAPLGDAVSIAWVERVPVHGQSRAPIAALAYALVPPAGATPPATRVEQEADALVDAGCDATRCYAVALARQPGMDAMVPGVARIVRYPR